MNRFYIITIGWPNPHGGSAMYTQTGTVNARTTEDAYQWAFQNASRTAGARNPNTLFFYLEPTS